MTEERRYDDDEMRRIFRLATEAGESRGSGSASGGSGTGMTLAELQAIALEAGIEPEQVARAAARLDAIPAPPPVRLLGVPISVGHAVELPSPPTDTEWDRLVVQLRDTFRARGRVSREGSLRSWTNGNLQVLVEPTDTGHRLRMWSVSSDLRGRLGIGLGFLALGALGILAKALTGALGDSGTLAGLLFTGGVGAGFLAWGTVGASRWTALRNSQFQEIGSMAHRMVSGRAAPPLSTGDTAPED